MSLEDGLLFCGGCPVDEEVPVSFCWPGCSWEPLTSAPVRKLITICAPSLGIQSHGKLKQWHSIATGCKYTLFVGSRAYVCLLWVLLVAGTQGWRCVGLRFASYREKCCNLHQISCCETHRNKLRKSKLTWAALLNQFSLYPPQVPRFEQKRDLPALSTTPLMWWWKLAILPPSPVALTEARSQLLSGYATISC